MTTSYICNTDNWRVIEMIMIDDYYSVEIINKKLYNFLLLWITLIHNLN
jgi:hypothetical protein